MIYMINIMLVFFYWGIIQLIPLSENRRKIAFLIICSVQMGLIVGTRQIWVGVDTSTYYVIFQSASNITSIKQIFTGAIEPFYLLLCWLVSRVGLEFVWLNVVMAMLTMYFYSKAIYKISSNVYISMILYIFCCMFYNMMNQYRQTLAMAIVLYAITFLRDGKKVRFVLWICVAGMFHYTAFVAIALLLLNEVKIKKKIVGLYAALLIFYFLLHDQLIQMVTYTKYGVYLNSLYNVHMQASTLYNLAIRITLLIGCFAFYERLKKNINHDLDIFFHMAIICTILQVLTTQSALYGRVTTYFFYTYFILIPEIAHYGYKKRENEKIVTIAFVLLFAIYHWVYVNNVGFDLAPDYSSYLFS